MRAGAAAVRCWGRRTSRRSSSAARNAVAWAWPRELAALAKQLSARSFGPATAKYRELGTASNLLVFNRLHALPTRNFQQGSFEAAEALSPESLSASREQDACFLRGLYDRLRAHLPAGSHVRRAADPRRADRIRKPVRPGQPVRHRRCRRGAGGLAPLRPVGPGHDQPGRHRGVRDGVRRTRAAGCALAAVRRRTKRCCGASNWSAAAKAWETPWPQGSRRLAEQIGQGSLDFAPQVKGLELPGYEPRALQTMALGLAVGTRGADHNRSSAYEVDFSAQRRPPPI